MDDERRPWWQITTVFDPDGTGSDFGYTVGLAERGLPELHLWSRPSLGDDPGLDWRFSLRDTGSILNEQAWRLVDGELGVGDTWDQSFDEGFVTARFSVHEAVESGEVDAFGAGDAPVLPIRWELVRPPVGPARPLDDAARTRAREEYDALVAGLLPETAPDGWRLPSEPAWEPDQVFGPRTPLVLARAAEIRQADADSLADVLDQALVAARWGAAGYATLVARAAAREPGRTAAVERLEDAAATMVAGLGATWGREAWQEMRDWVLDGVAPAERDELWAGAMAELVTAVTACLVVEAVADLVAGHIVTYGQGIVRTAIALAESAPDERWRCSASVRDAVTALVAATPAERLGTAALAWDEVVSDEGCWEILALGWTTPTYPPALAAELPDTLAGTATLRRWLHALATVLTHRALLDPEAVDLFLSCGRGIDSLEELVNTPLVGPEHD